LPINRDDLTWNEFEFLITGEIIMPHQCDEVLTPIIFKWSKFYIDKWPYNKVGDDYYTFSIEMPGLQIALIMRYHIKRLNKLH